MSWPLWRALSSTCGEVARTGRSPVMLVIDSLEGASGAEPDAFGNVLYSDVETIVENQVAGQTVSGPDHFQRHRARNLPSRLEEPRQRHVAARPVGAQRGDAHPVSRHVPPHGWPQYSWRRRPACIRRRCHHNHSGDRFRCGRSRRRSAPGEDGAPIERAAAWWRAQT